MTQNGTQKTQKTPKYICEKCCFKTDNKNDYTRHTLTPKHNSGTNVGQMKLKNSKLCCSCNIFFNSRSSLYRHKKTCKIEKEKNDENNDKNDENDDNDDINNNDENNENNDENDDNDNDNDNNDNYDDSLNNNNLIMEILKQNQEFKEMILDKPSSDNKDSLIMELVKQNQEFKELMLEQNKYMLELAKNTGNNTNTNCNNTNNNTKFNLQFFLNDTCKDAMNITDFVNSLVLDFEDLENMGHLGYVEGISRIFMRGIRGMDVTKRPFHCSDIKRETMFVKELEGWEKENSDNEKMTMTIKRIACKNLRQATAWMAAHQKAIADTDSKPHSQYMKMMSQCLGGATAAEDKLNYNKIIRRVAQEVFIDKNKD